MNESSYLREYSFIKLKVCKVKNKSLCLDLIFFSRPFWFYICNVDAYLINIKWTWKLLGDQDFCLPESHRWIGMSNHLITWLRLIDKNFQSSLLDKIRAAVPDLWPWWSLMPVGPGSGQVAGNRDKKEAGRKKKVRREDHDFSKSRAVRNILYNVLFFSLYAASKSEP